MKTFTRVLSITLITLFAFSECEDNSKTQFTETQQQELEKLGIKLDRVQFYLSHSIILTKETTKLEETGTDQGNVTVNRGKYIDQIEILKETPGVLVSSTKSTLCIQFKQDDDCINFQKLWATGIYSIVNQDGDLKYRNSTYSIFSKEDIYAEEIHLTYNHDETLKINKSKETLEGVKLK